MSDRILADWSEADCVPISALRHWQYCPRSCALIHVESIFDENVYTLRGRMLHEKVDQPGGESRDGVRIERAVPLWCDRLGLVGKADVVEFHGDVPYPVEYKLGRRRSGGAVLFQLCAQAMCLEEMTGQAVPAGAIYYHGSRRRREVAFTQAMRVQVEEATLAIRQTIREGRLPPPAHDARCRLCSLADSCMPSLAGEQGRVRAVVRSLYLASDDPPR
ncbi:MAG: CRISPR-associated protein Cas4 [Thermoguttaceae bacterium]|jgi:CRISPR-associated exonuclease Cas4|nr:CRISPR-associated protein Cas4 [Thermoguttaceae bacterium]